MDGLIIADASKVTPSQFIAFVLGEPEEDARTLFGKLWVAIRDGDRDEEARCKARLAEMRAEMGL